MATSLLDRLLGPRVAPDELRRHGFRYGLPSLLLLAARIMILVSLFLPYWRMELHAPQYPNNLHLQAYVNHLTGDVAEIDGLNHYIGMRPLEEAARFERSAGVYLLILVAVLLEIAAAMHNRWAALLAAPAIFFPAVFLIDLHLWLRHFGLNLDPDAPLSSAVDPFVPPVLGTGLIGQFKTVASAGPGLWLVAGSSVIIIAALFFHRRARNPPVEGGASP